jgi:hypothetical protein
MLNNNLVFSLSLGAVFLFAVYLWFILAGGEKRIPENAILR